MAFHVLINSTTADASDVNENFYHIRQGSVLPVGGSSLSYTNSVYDLGSSSYKWKDFYANNIYTDDIYVSGAGNNGSLFRKIYSEILSATSTRIEITGLNGDNDNEYMLFIKHVWASATNIYSGAALFLNGNSAGTCNLRVWRSLTTASISFNTADNNFKIGTFINYGAAQSTCCMGHWLIYGQSGNIKMIMGELAGGFANAAITGTEESQAGVYNGTETLTSMVLIGTYDAGSQITLFKCG
jgi:hypothetical protein